MTTPEGTTIIAALGVARALARTTGVFGGRKTADALAKQYLQQHDEAVQAVKDLEPTGPITDPEAAFLRLLQTTIRGTQLKTGLPATIWIQVPTTMSYERVGEFCGTTIMAPGRWKLG